MLNEDRIIEKVETMLEVYAERVGNGYAAVYLFPGVMDATLWSQFLSVAYTTLARKSQYPIHAWIANGTERLLVLLVNGHFRSSVDDVTADLCRLWARRHTDTMPMLIYSAPFDFQTEPDVSLCIGRILSRVDYDYFPPCHKRSFGYSLRI